MHLLIFLIALMDLSGHELSFNDGPVTELVLATTNEVDRAQKVGDLTPDYCLGNPKYRMVTLLEFPSQHSAPVRAFIDKVAGRRIDGIARELQTRYDALGIKKEARRDVFVGTDFDGSIAKQFGISLGEHVFQFFVINSEGKVVQHWSEVPTRETLDAALRAAAAQ